jgi:hypothetical protein
LGEREENKTGEEGGIFQNIPILNHGILKIDE